MIQRVVRVFREVRRGKISFWHFPAIHFGRGFDPSDRFVLGHF
jgi:hypothetical protein